MSLGKEKVQALYEDFVHHAGSWTRGCIYREIIGCRSHKAQGVRKWLTRTQLLEYYTEDQVESIVLRKEADPDLMLAQVRQHPELPGTSSSMNECVYVILISRRPNPLYSSLPYLRSCQHLVVDTSALESKVSHSIWYSLRRLRFRPMKPQSGICFSLLPT